MKIALDYDGTYTACPSFWFEIIRMCKRGGHTIDIVTLRDAVRDRVHDEAKLLGLGIGRFVYCDGRPKSQVIEERGLSYDIWIEDNPLSIYLGTDLDPTGLAAWRANDKHRDKEIAHDASH